MAKSGRKRGARPRQRPLTRREADDRIAELRSRHVASRTEAEDLDAPLDPAVRVSADFPSHKVALVVDGKEISGLTVVDFQQQIGSQTVHMGGIGGVHTHPDHRFRGYMRRVMENALRWMRQNGFETSMLYGIRAFYPRFGYAQAFPSVQFSMAVRDAERVEPAGYRFVSFAPEHLRAVLRMYHRSTAGRTGPTRRDPRHWRPFRKGASYGSKAICKVALDKRARPAGYFVVDGERLTAVIIEVGFATRKVFADILRATARRALRQRLERIRLILPEDDAFIEFCQPLGLHKEVTYRSDGGGGVRMINIPGALSKLAAELGSRMRGPGRLTLRTNLDDVGLSWSKGTLSVGRARRSGPQARMPQWALAQLLYGYRSAEALATDGILEGPHAAVAALAEMFPVTPHLQYLVDHF